MTDDHRRQARQASCVSISFLGAQVGRELYDHDVDPKELTNLADVPAHADTVAELSKQLAAAVQTTMPVDGVVPKVKPGLWNPNVTNP